MSRPDCFLVVAHSARLLARSAARAGHPVCALDLFNDRDTGDFALACEAVRPRAGATLGFDRADLLRRADRVCPPSRCLGLVYGAGFEDDTGTLALLAQGRELLGNRPEVVAQLKDPARFFGLLDRLGIAHPETALARPRACRGWLYKRSGATGGDHVIEAADAAPAAEAAGYFQRREPGTSLSVLFLADGRRAETIGISRQLARGRGSHRYQYAGAVGPVAVPRAASRALRDALQALVAHTGLIGCNSVDFLLEGNRPAVLEVNPRPSATADLYDASWPAGLFEAHLNACRGHLPGTRSRGAGTIVRAHAIVYAGAPLRIGPDTAFAPWCTDIPRAGSTVAPEAPVCTVHAEGADAAAALRRLRRRRRSTVLNLTTRLDSEETRNGSTTDTTQREPQRRAAGRIAAGAARRAAAGRASP